MDTDLYANLVFKLEQRVKEEWFTLCGLIITSTCSCKHQKAKYVSYQNEFFLIKMRAAFLLSPSFITQGRIGARKALPILLKHPLGHHSN